MGYSITIFDSNQKPGGMMRYGIPAYRLPKEVLDGEISRLYEIGLEFKMGVRAGKDITWEDLDNRFKAVFIAIGAWEETSLELKGQNTKAVFNALEFLGKINLGKRPEIGKKIAVIGGGNSAIDCARACRRLGAEVTIVYRRGEAEMPAHVEEIEMAREEGIRFLFLAGPIELHGAGIVAGVKLERMALGEADESGRRRPMPTGETFDIDCDGMITATGEATRVDDLPPFISCSGGIVEINQMGQTTRPGFFAGGDIIDIPHTVTHAIGSGKVAAVAIDRFLKGIESAQDNLDRFRWGDSGNISLARLKGTSLFCRRNPSLEVIAYRDMNPFYFDHRPGTKVRRLPLEERLKGFQEVIEPFLQQEAVSEARRCFNCGSCTECGNCYIFCPENSIRTDPDGYGYVADMDYCKGCGICINECPRGAMRMGPME